MTSTFLDVCSVYMYPPDTTPVENDRTSRFKGGSPVNCSTHKTFGQKKSVIYVKRAVNSCVNVVWVKLQLAPTPSRTSIRRFNTGELKSSSNRDQICLRVLILIPVVRVMEYVEFHVRHGFWVLIPMMVLHKRVTTAIWELPVAIRTKHAPLTVTTSACTRPLLLVNTSSLWDEPARDTGGGITSYRNIHISMGRKNCRL